MKKIWLMAVAIAMVFPITTVKAADFRAPETESGNITVSNTEQTHNLYLAGANVTNNAIVTGDLVTAGSNVTVNGTVEHSLLAAGGNITINAGIGQNARVAGGTVVFNGQVGEDLAVGGGTVEVTQTALVTGDLMIASGALKIDGTVNGKVYGTGGDVIISGHIKGDVVLKDISSLEISSTTVIDGKLTYSSIKEAKINSSAKIIGGTNFQQKSSKNGDFGSGIFFSIWMMIGSLLLGLVFVFGFRRTTSVLIEENRSKFWTSMGIGFVALIVVPVACLIIMITIVGMKIAMILGMFYWLFLMLGSMLNSLFLGSEAYNIFKKSDKRRNDWLTVIIGTILNTILILIPVFGWIVWFGIYLSSFGTLLRHAFAEFPQKH